MEDATNTGHSSRMDTFEAVDTITTSQRQIKGEHNHPDSSQSGVS